MRNNDPFFPLTAAWAQGGVLQQGDPDQGVPVGQLFSPPYLFTFAGTLAARPVVRRSPREIEYRGHFDIEVAGTANTIAAVTLLRSDHNTHSVTTGDRYVKLAFLPIRRGSRNSTAARTDRVVDGACGDRGPAVGDGRP